MKRLPLIYSLAVGIAFLASTPLCSSEQSESAKHNEAGIKLCRQAKYAEALAEFQIALKTAVHDREQELCVRKNIVAAYKGLGSLRDELWRAQREVYFLENKLHGTQIPPAFMREKEAKLVDEDSSVQSTIRGKQLDSGPSVDLIAFYRRICAKPTRGNERLKSVGFMTQFLENLDEFIHLKQKIAGLKGEEQVRAKAKCVTEAESIRDFVTSMKFWVKVSKDDKDYETAMYLIEGMYRGMFVIDSHSPELSEFRAQHEQFEKALKSDLLEKAGRYK